MTLIQHYNTVNRCVYVLFCPQWAPKTENGACWTTAVLHHPHRSPVSCCFVTRWELTDSCKFILRWWQLLLLHTINSHLSALLDAMLVLSQVLRHIYDHNRTSVTPSSSAPVSPNRTCLWSISANQWHFFYHLDRVYFNSISLKYHDIH